MKIIDVINRERKLRGFKVQELALVCAVSKTQMSNYLLGKNRIPFDVASLCLDIMGLSLIVGELIDGDFRPVKDERTEIEFLGVETGELPGDYYISYKENGKVIKQHVIQKG